MTDEPTIRITVNGKPALTIAQAAERHGMPASGLRTALTRLPDLKPAAHLDARTPLYYAATLDKALATRPRSGRPHAG